MIEKLLENKVLEALRVLYSHEEKAETIQLQVTKKEFKGDFTLVVFPFTKLTRKSPEATASEIGEYLLQNMKEIASFNVIKGFLNLEIQPSYWMSFYLDNAMRKDFGFVTPSGSHPVVIEYSSPNTNKPLHLGHIRNNLLGFSISRILEAYGEKVVKVNLVNDRGIHICKSMLAWQKWGEGETPESSGLKGDHLVGKYYVIFDKHYKQEIEELISSGVGKDEAAKSAPLIIEAQEMLRKWEAHDKDVVELWSMMNSWVYSGFEITYKNLGINFDKTYYESKTYLLGKELVEQGVLSSALYRKEDSSVWIDLTAEGLDEKLLLRSDGTSVYMTQDLGTAQQRFDEYQPRKLIYVVGNEQEYHFQVLKKVLMHLGREWSDSLYHLSYGMVELPEGKMKSREGTVVDADDLMQEMIDTARTTTMELGKIEDFDNEEAFQLFRTIGLGALKYFILKVDPKKNMLFNPTESIDFNGNTGPFIQYTYARIRSVIRNAENIGLKFSTDGSLIEAAKIHDLEKALIKILHQFPSILKDAALNHSPAVIANYSYELACSYNRFYHELSVLKEADELLRNYRLGLCHFTSNVIRNSMWLLGIDVPERM